MSKGGYWCLRGVKMPIGVCGCLLESVGPYWSLRVPNGV